MKDLIGRIVYACPLCTANFKNEAEYICHMRNTHESFSRYRMPEPNRFYACPICRNLYLTKDDLHDHERMHDETADLTPMLGKWYDISSDSNKREYVRPSSYEFIDHFAFLTCYRVCVGTFGIALDEHLKVNARRFIGHRPIDAVSVMNDLNNAHCKIAASVLTTEPQ